MSVFIDRDFLTRISPQLQKFVKKKDDLYNFRCPICGDSQKNKSKSRGYVYRKKNDYFFMCHNCGAGMSFFNFLKRVEPTLVEAYQLERFKQSANYNSPEPNFDMAKEKPVFAKKLELSDRYLSHVKNGRKNIGAAIARQIEKRLRLPHGWMDNPHTNALL